MKTNTQPGLDHPYGRQFKGRPATPIMQRYTIYRTPKLPNTYLVLEADSVPRKIVPFNLLYLAGEPEPTKIGVSPSYLPFAAGSRNAILEWLDLTGYCFYRWPGKILGADLGDVLEVFPADTGPAPSGEPDPDAPLGS